MKICVVMGSPRKGDSFNVCKEVEDQIICNDNNVEFDYIFLNKYKVQECRGCSLCFQKSEEYCPLKDDDLKKIKEKLLNCDAVVFASPVYAYHVTAQMKKFIDRMSYLFHRQELVGVPALIVVTTDGGGISIVYKYLKMTLAGWGLDVVDNIQIISPMYFEKRTGNNPWGYDKKYYEKSHKKIVSASNKLYMRMHIKIEKVPTFYDIFMFNCLRSKTYTSASDREYWKEKGWLYSEYFYKVDIGFAKKFFGWIMRNVIDVLGRKYIKA